ncbi:MAG TPA: methyltransferase domain-containing protein [Rhodopila sp.]|uniref:class I SAM-dependent methyltransferase n=1 Tax=Rhodopila sp. TaxID=2480087 RepID=UPI002B783FD8|nr:methyltransferase domain-containing protein [Rhodopila sp.]HVY15410.1 methyltransferase domain-containing protein [Rhodopila sp.]
MSDPDAVRAFEHAGWQVAAAGYEASFATATRPFIPALLDRAGIGSGQTVLDVACGPGFTAAAAAGRGAAARGLDFSAAMLAVARERHPGLVFDQGDAEALPYADAAFDAVVSNFGIHHAPNPVNALADAGRVLRPGGRLAFTVWADQGSNIAWKLVFDAIRTRGDMTASKAPPPGGGLNDPDACLSAMARAGLVEGAVVHVRHVWRHPDGAALLTALRSGTARMAALIGAQTPEALAAIAAEIDVRAASHRDAQGLGVPIAAFVVSGRRDGRA